MIEMLKTRTGKVSDLLEVEDEIAKVRGEIETMEGQLRVYDAQVQFATVTITLQEKDINQAAAYLLQEHAQLSLFVKDVEKAFADAKGDAVATRKAQTLESHIERDSAGRVVATLHLLIPPDASDEAITKFKDIGRIEHFNSQTQRLARDGSENSDTAKMDRDKVELNLVIQQDAENPVQGTNISVQTDQVEDKTNEIKKAAADAGVEVKGAEFTRAHNGVEVSAMLLRMPMSKYAGFIEQIKSLGKVKDFTVARREDSTATNEAPAEIVLQIFSQPNIVGPETGLGVTVRSTLGEGMSALMWSLRMIGVTLAWIAPWAGDRGGGRVGDCAPPPRREKAGVNNARRRFHWGTAAVAIPPRDFSFCAFARIFPTRRGVYGHPSIFFKIFEGKARWRAISRKGRRSIRGTVPLTPNEKHMPPEKYEGCRDREFNPSWRGGLRAYSEPIQKWKVTPYPRHGLIRLPRWTTRPLTQTPQARRMR